MIGFLEEKARAIRRRFWRVLGEFKEYPLGNLQALIFSLGNLIEKGPIKSPWLFNIKLSFSREGEIFAEENPNFWIIVEN